jgi:DcaP outer membrane protein
MNRKTLSLLYCLTAVSVNTSADNISLQAQIDLLRQELQHVRQELSLLRKGVATENITAASKANLSSNNQHSKLTSEPKPFLGLSRSDMQVKLNGYVRTDIIYDNERTGNNNSFVPAQIPVKWKQSNGGDGDYHIGVDPTRFSRGEQTNMHVKQSRLGIEATGDTPLGAFRSRLEGDFFGSNSNFRIRHAYGELGNWLVGKTWPNFGSLETLPNTLDFEGPGSQLPGRNEQVRYRLPLDQHWTWTVALEDSKYEVTNVDSANCGAVTCSITDFSNIYPDFVTNISFDNGPHFLHLSLAWAKLEVDAEIDNGTSIFEKSFDINGQGAVVGGRHRFGDNDMLQYQYVWVDGMGHLITDIGNNDVAGNAVLVDNGQKVEELETLAGQIAWQHWWHPELSSTLVYSQVVLDNHDEQGSHAYHKTLYTSANLVWQLSDRITTGIEYLYGERTNNNGETGHANRLQFMSQFNFD